MPVINTKDISGLRKLTTKRLLAYYQAERRRLYALVSSNTCDCCGESSWDLYGGHDKEKAELAERENYLTLIKTELNKREHVK